MSEESNTEIADLNKDLPSAPVKIEENANDNVESEDPSTTSPSTTTNEEEEDRDSESEVDTDPSTAIDTNGKNGIHNPSEESTEQELDNEQAPETSTIRPDDLNDLPSDHDLRDSNRLEDAPSDQDLVRDSSLNVDSLPDNRSSRSHSLLSHSTINTHASIGFLKVAFENIMAHSREMKKFPRLQKSCANALDKLNSGIFPEANVIFEPLRLASQSTNVDIKLEALECLSKTFTFNVFSDLSEVYMVNLNDANSETPLLSLIDAAIETIADCFEGEGTNEKLELQVIRGLMAGVVNESIPAHGSTLLRAVRQIYNVFILSLSSKNQTLAQASLIQVVDEVFGRINKVSITPYRASVSSKKEAEDLVPPIVSTTELPITLNTFENTDDDQRVEEANQVLNDDENVAVKDAFLVFRAMCKLSVKSLESDTLDMRSHPIRSKLLSLHLIYDILKKHISCFSRNDVVITSTNGTEDTRLIDAVRQYICLTLSRNAASSLAPVYEITLEIFWILLSTMRSEFKREIPLFFTEIYFPVSEMKTSTSHQKRYLLSIINRLCNDPKAVIEIYLNYDCDSTMPNITESIVDYLTKLSLTKVDVTATQKTHYRESLKNSLATYNLTSLPLLSINKLGSHPPNPEGNNAFPTEYALKMTSIDCIVAFLKSLSSWSDKSNGTSMSRSRDVSFSQIPPTPNLADSPGFNPNLSNASFSNEDDPLADDPTQFEKEKSRKKALLEGVRQFNYKPKKGVERLIKDHFIVDSSPEAIADFLLQGDYGLDKAVVGEYLGEGDDFNISVMHLFIEKMDFTGLTFTDAMRSFLQNFRLPGESQKIDRFMLKFAEKFYENNPDTFSNADVAYILAYSVVMLNTDQHSPQVKVRMTVDDFIKNNRGIDNNQDVPHEILNQIFNDIHNNEIKLLSEQHLALLAGGVGEQSTGLFGSKDASREQYMMASREMASKTEQLVKNLGRLSKSAASKFYSATPHLEHVRSIFQTMWMSILSGLTPPFKENDDGEITKICVEGLKLSIHIACMFELEVARATFIQALVQFANLNNLEEMTLNNITFIYALLDVAAIEGNVLKESWHKILISVSQIERIQLLAQGYDSNTVPDVAVARLANRSSFESTRTNGSVSQSFFSSLSASLSSKKTSPSQLAFEHYQNQQLNPLVVPELTSTDLEVAIDKIFSSSNQLDGEGIIDFVRALTEVSEEEIESSGQSESPRMFALQKMVDVCYYNMDRIRFQWSQLWSIMGEAFNKFGCHYNKTIVFFALDSLRQLSMRFFEIEELAHFKFQKEFLKPFSHIIKNNDSVEIKERVLESLTYMVQISTPKIKSGWITMFDTFTIAAQDKNERIVSKVMTVTNIINRDHFDKIYVQGGFIDLVTCFTELAKNQKFQKTSLHALSILKSLIQKVSRMSYGSEEERKMTIEVGDDKDVFHKLWFPVLFGYHDVIMTGEDLEVRSQALNFMFDSLVNYGGHFDSDFWFKICNQLLFPIFGVLSKRWEINQFNSNDDMSVWLSTTLIQALRNMIALFTHYFDTLNIQLDGYLNLLVSCICQENDTIARIGKSCLDQLIKQNMTKFDQSHWDKITDSFDQLFELTTAKELFKADPLNDTAGNGELAISENVDYDEIQGESSFDVSASNGGPKVDRTPSSPKLVKSLRDNEKLQKSREKSTIVVKCVLQLLMIETVAGLFDEPLFYSLVPLPNLLKLASFLENSYKFAKEFNDDYNLRVRLWNAGIIERLPNLLKQESSSAAVYISIMVRLYCDDEKVSKEERDEISLKLIPMCVTIIQRYVVLDEVQQQRNITTWRPVVVEILQGYDALDEQDFIKNCPAMYDLVLQTLDKSAPVELRAAIKNFLTRVGSVYLK